MKIKQLLETTAGAVASVAMPLGKTHKRTEEAATPAQQAAIAVNMKKAGKKPKNMKEDSYKGPHGEMDVDRSKKGVTKVSRKDYETYHPGISNVGKDVSDYSLNINPNKVHKDLRKLKKMKESLRDGEYYTFKVFFDDGSDETLNFSSDDIDWNRVGAKRDKKVVDVKRLGGIQGSQSDSPRKPHDFPDDRGLAKAQRAYDKQLPEGVAEGMFGLSDKEKGMIQNVAVEISDIPGYWDWKRDTFTPYGILELEKAFNDNKKYVKYALSLTADDYYHDLEEDWQKVNRRDKTSGMSRKAVKAYRRENPGSKLKTAVTTKPSKLKRGSKAAKRRKSFCARMSGNKGPMKKPNGKPTPKALALRRWNCESIEDMRKLIENAEKFIAEHKQINNEQSLSENLHKWFKEKWVRFGPDGKIRGDCARGDDSEGKPKCLPQSKAHSLGKKGRASAASRKRREDPNPERSGKAINVNTKKKTNEADLDEACWKGYHKEGNKKMFGKTYPNCVKNTNEEQQLDEKCWDTHKQVGMKKKGGKMVPNCVPKESIQEGHQQCPECGGAMYSEEMINEKKDACYYKVKSRYKVWPSAYASGALVKCRKKGAKNWGTKSESRIMQGMVEAHISEEELLLAPGQGIKFKTELMPKRTDHEVEMARNQLKSSFENAKDIYQNIKDLSEIQGLDGWVQAKITKASDYLEAVNQYIEGKKQMLEKELEVAEDQIDDRLTAQYNTPQMKAQSQAIDQAFASGDEEQFKTLGIMSPQQIEKDYQDMLAREPAQDAALMRNPKLTPGARPAPVQRYNPKGVPIRETERLSTREKFKRSLKRAGYDPDARADRLLKLIARQAEERAERERKEKEQDEEFYKNRIKEDEPTQPNNQEEQPKSNKLFDVLKSIGDVALPVGRAIYGMQGRDIPADIKSDVKTMIRNKVTGEPNK